MDPDSDTRNLIDAYKGLPVEAVAADMASRAFPYHIAIENYQHDFNIGSIVRNANAFNAAGVHIVGKRRWNRRGAMMTESYLRLYHHDTPEQLAEWARVTGLSVVGIDNIPGSSELHTAQLPDKAMFVFGQEGPGLSENMQALCSQIIAIEQFGSTRSVNVGVASGIIMYEWVERRALETGE